MRGKTKILPAFINYYAEVHKTNPFAGSNSGV